MLSIKRLKTAQLSGDYLQLQDQDQTVTGCLQPLAQFSLLCRLRHGLFSVARCLGNVYNFSAVIMAKNCFRSDDFFSKAKPVAGWFGTRCFWCDQMLSNATGNNLSFQQGQRAIYGIQIYDWNITNALKCYCEHKLSSQQGQGAIYRIQFYEWNISKS